MSLTARTVKIWWDRENVTTMFVQCACVCMCMREHVSVKVSNSTSHTKTLHKSQFKRMEFCLDVRQQLDKKNYLLMIMNHLTRFLRTFKQISIFSSLLPMAVILNYFFGITCGNLPELNANKINIINVLFFTLEYRNFKEFWSLR